jgi:hypothetical protein
MAESLERKRGLSKKREKLVQSEMQRFGQNMAILTAAARGPDDPAPASGPAEESVGSGRGEPRRGEGGTCARSGPAWAPAEAGGWKVWGLDDSHLGEGTYVPPGRGGSGAAAGSPAGAGLESGLAERGPGGTGPATVGRGGWSALRHHLRESVGSSWL